MASVVRRGFGVGLLVGWLLGIGTGLLGVTATVGWYEYLLIGRDDAPAFVNNDGWEVVRIIPNINPREEATVYVRRPRFRLP